jgi:hypothetical protein
MKTIALATLSLKLSLLFCVSGIGALSLVQTTLAAPLAPCHQEMVQENQTKAPCDVCDTAMTAWEQDAISTAEVLLAPPTGQEVTLVKNLPSVTFEIKSFVGIYTAYNPPPRVLLNAVTPITKTIVLLS